MEGITPICPYCRKFSELISTTEIYGADHDYGWAYLCRPCNAYVGCHTGTTTPKGTLANATLREARKQAHIEFDWIWKSKHMRRKKAYGWLSNKMGYPKGETCHIGACDLDECHRIVLLCKEYRKEVEPPALKCTEEEELDARGNC